MWLLDANMPLQVRGVLHEFGVVAESAEYRGWKALKNGELVAAAVAAGFTCILTRDRSFSESAAKNLNHYPDFGVVLVTIAQMRGPEFIAEFQRAWAESPIRPIGGTVVPGPSQ
jgi:hypothetical protein